MSLLKISNENEKKSYSRTSVRASYKPNYCKAQVYKTYMKVTTDHGLKGQSGVYFGLDVHDYKSGNNGWHGYGDWSSSGSWNVYYSDFPNLDVLEFRTRMKVNNTITNEWAWSARYSVPKFKVSPPDQCKIQSIDTRYNRLKYYVRHYEGEDYDIEYYMDIYDGGSNGGWHCLVDWTKQTEDWVYNIENRVKEIDTIQIRCRIKYNGTYSGWTYSDKMRNPFYKKPFTPQPPDVLNIWIDGDKLNYYVRCYDAETYDTQFYVDIYDGDMSTNNGWHCFSDWSYKNEDYFHVSKYKNIATFQLRARLKVDGMIYNNWKYSEKISNPFYQKPKPSKFYDFNNIRIGNFKPDITVSASIYKVYMMKWSYMRNFYLKINEICEIMGYTKIVDDWTINTTPENGNSQVFTNRCISALNYIKVLCSKMGVYSGNLVSEIKSGNIAKKSYFIEMQNKLNECIDNIK